MNLELGEFIVMSNYFHGIMIIGNNKYNAPTARRRRDAMYGVSTSTGTTQLNQFGPQSKNLGSIIRGVKSSVTTQIKKSGSINFALQPRFHNHIIRDAASFEQIQNYIINNILNWNEDKFFSLQPRNETGFLISSNNYKMNCQQAAE